MRKTQLSNVVNMRKYQARNRTSNSAANSLPAPFWRTKFRCEDPRRFHAKLLTSLLFLVIRNAFRTTKKHISLLSRSTPLFGGGEVGALAAQFGDPLAGVEIGPVAEGKVGDLARVVAALGNADLLAGDVDGADPAPVLQQPDVAQRREVERDEIGRPAGFEDADAVAFGHEAGIDLGRRAQCRGRGEAEILDKEFELAGVPFAIGGDGKAGIGAGQQRHAGVARLLPVGAADLVFAPGAL